MPDLWMDVDTALAEVPVNILPLLDDTDFKSREVAIAYDAAGMDLVWNFVTCAGAFTQTAVTPTTGGNYDWAHQGNGMYTIEIPASGGASINNDTEGFGWFTGYATGVLPWRGPVIGFRAAGLNDKMIDSAYSATRGLTGTALPDAAADAAGGLPISDAGGLDLDAKIGALAFTVAGDVDVNVQSWKGAAAQDMTGDSYARLGAPAGASIAADIAAVEAQTDDIGAAGAGLTAVPWNAAWDAEVQSEATDALNAYDPPNYTEMAARTLAAADYATATALATVDANIDAILADTGTDGVVVASGAITAAVIATGAIDADAIADNAIDAGAIAASAITSAKFAAGAVDAAALAADAANEIADATLDRANAVETGLTMRQALRIIAAACAGKISGVGTATIVIRNAVVDGTDRIVATVDVNGNRTAIAYDLT